MSVEQIGQALVFTAYFTENGLGKAGLSPTINVGKHGGTIVADTQAMTEVHATKLAGLYIYTLSGGANDAASAYVAKASVGSGADMLEVPAGILVGTQWVERIDAAISAAVSAADAATAAVALLENLSQAQAQAAAASALSAFGAATDTNVDAAETAVLAAIALLNNLSASGAQAAAAAALSAYNAAQVGSQMTLPDGHLTDAKFGADVDVYTAEVWLVDDDNGSTDRYLVQWYKNGALVTSGITDPTINVFKASDGTDLVAETAMTEVASKGVYKYEEATNRITDGLGYVVHVEATIDAALRSARQPLGNARAA